jgi:conjugal transfer pilus assembly protein TraB
MSDQKPGLGGLFVNKKASAPAAAPANGGKKKNVNQRWLMLGVGALGFIVISSSFFSKKAEPVRSEKKADTVVNVTPKGVDKQDWMNQSAGEIRSLQSDNTQLANKLESVSQQLKKLQDEKDKADAAAAKAAKDAPAVPSGVVAPPTMADLKNGGTKPAGTSAVVPPPPPPTIPLPKSGVPAGTQGVDGAIPAIPQSNFSGGEAQVFKPEARPVATPAAAAANSAEAVYAKTKYKKNAYNGYLPAGAFAPVVLLNGLDAGTSSSTQANPMPVLMNITDNATLPGAAKYQLKSCFILGTGYGDMSAERVYFRFSRLSCVDKADRLVLSADVAGYLVDSDGKIGLRGKVVDRQGAKLGKALIAGFAQGLASSFGNAQSTVSTTALGSTSSLSGDAALRASGLTGAQTAAQQLAQFYLKEAQAMFPVISVDTGRTGTIVFTDNTSLTWASGDGAFVKEVKPE